MHVDFSWTGNFGNARARHIQCFYWDDTFSSAHNARSILAGVVDCLVRRGLDDIVGALGINTMIERRGAGSIWRSWRRRSRPGTPNED